MTRPTREEVAAVFEALSNEEYRGNHEWYQAIGESRDAVLSLFPEGRSEQDQGGVIKAVEDGYRILHREPRSPFTPERAARMVGEFVKCVLAERARAEGLEADLSAARLRNKALEAQLARVQPLLSDEDRMHPVGCSTWVSDAFVIGEEITALLSSAQGETKEGFDGLPELPCGSRDEPTVAATAALAGGEVEIIVKALVDEHGVYEDDEHDDKLIIATPKEAVDTINARYRQAVDEANRMRDDGTVQPRCTAPRDGGWVCDGTWHRGWDGHDPYCDRCPKARPRAPDAAALVEGE